ncbi:uncharacterized protein LOC144353325 [Saccoglossus kowalevskii]
MLLTWVWWPGGLYKHWRWWRTWEGQKFIQTKDTLEVSRATLPLLSNIYRNCLYLLSCNNAQRSRVRLAADQVVQNVTSTPLRSSENTRGFTYHDDLGVSPSQASPATAQSFYNQGATPQFTNMASYFDRPSRSKAESPFHAMESIHNSENVLQGHLIARK